MGPTPIGCGSTMALASSTVSGSLSGAPPQFFQQPNFGSQPYHTTIGSSCMGFSHSQPQPSLKHTQIPNDRNSFVMTYSGPYSATMHDFPRNTTAHSNFVAPNYTQNLTPQFYSAPFTFATSTTAQVSQSPYSSYNQAHHSASFNQQPLPQSTPQPVPMFHTIYPNPLFQAPPLPLPHSYSPPYVDPNLPTMKQMRLDFSVFSGGDPVEWLNKAEQYFEFYQIPEDRKLSIATMHLSDKASDRWYMFKHEFPSTWQGLADLLMREFSGYNRTEYQAALARMSQTGSVEHYKEQFTKLSRRAPGFPQEVLLPCFIGGLKEDIRVDVQAQKPRTLYEACELARVYETRNEGHRHYARNNSGGSRASVGSPVGVHTKTHSFSTGTKVQTTPFTSKNMVNNTAGHTNGTRRLSHSKYQERRAKNQCFFCEEPFKPGHNCRKGQLMIMEVLQEDCDLLNSSDDMDTTGVLIKYNFITSEWWELILTDGECFIWNSFYCGG